MTHTPSPSDTPWKVVTDGFKNGFAAIETEDGGYEVVSSCRHDNAAFIVKACNVHDELVEEISKARLLLKHGPGKNDILQKDAVKRIDIILTKIKGAA